MPGEDRLTALCEQNPPVVTGIDFVQVVDPRDQTALRVFFLIDPDDLTPPIVDAAALPADIPPDSVAIVSTSGGETLAQVPVVRATFLEVTVDGGDRTVLEIETSRPGDFSIYRLTIDHPQIDRFYNGVEFSFKQGCPGDLDCRPTSECPPEERVDFPIDYLARDFWSLRGALLDFAAQRYPEWAERIEADVGVMLAEVMAALGDELAYIQDRYARESHLETATQRRSLRWHTRLVDYAIHDGLAAATHLAVEAVGGVLVPAGARFSARPEGEPAIPFEIGAGLADQRQGVAFWVHEAWNAIPAHVPDQDAPCLPAGSTEIYLRGALPLADQLPEPEPGADPVPPEEFWIGRLVALKSQPEDPSLPARRHLARVTEVEITEDPLCLDEGGDPMAITRLRWESEQALPFELCLRDTEVCANVLPATAGETFTEHFVIAGNEDLPLTPAVPTAVERQGACNEISGERSLVLLHSLAETESAGLGWVGEPRAADPEVELQEVNPATLAPLAAPRFWEYRRSLVSGSQPFDDHFTLDDGTWRRVIGFERGGEEIVHRDYASGDGFTVRFGDGEFGRTPTDGTVFQARYRSGPGRRANVAADTVVHLEDPPPAGIVAVTNPLPVTGGIDPESAEEIKLLAPEAFKELFLRAVRDEDYEAIAERLPWVQRAGSTARWTGSWLTQFTTADPLGAFELSAERRTELEALLDCVRLVGREVYVRDPRYLSIDLQIAICVDPSAYPGQVKQRVVEALTGGSGAFFAPDNFTFGDPLRRSALEAAVQAVPGVRGVDRIRIRERGISDWRDLTELVLEVADDRILRLQNDRRFPERGSLRVRTRNEAAA